jgi:Ca-activated chloride channel family protein
MMENTTLHFLRPEWLLALVPAFWLVWKLWKQTGRQGAWNAIISPRFKPVLLGEKSEESVFPWPVLGLAILWSIAIIALSGPSWKQVEVPAEKNHQGTVILFDLSLSMLSDDLKPNRLSRARYKILDLLKAHPELNVGMVAYAGTAHTIAPISEDNQTLLALTPNLSPLIMPSFGANAVAGFEQAQTLFKGAHVKHGHILWVTDDVESSELAAITEQVKQHHLQLSILVVGTPNGGPIQVPNYGLIKDENGKIVLAKVPFQRFQTLAQQTDATLSTLSMEDVDTAQLLPNSLSGFGTDDESASDKTLSNWLDEGVFLLWLLVPLGALAYRRGWAFSWLSVGLLGLTLSGGLVSPSPVWAKDVKTDDNTSVTLLDVFKSPDQQGYEKWLKQDYDTALDRFEDPLWRGASLYRQGKYKEAAKQFSLDESAQGHYNQGNALAKLGQFEDAKEQYEKALKANPKFTDAQKNRDLMDQILEVQKQQKAQESGEKQRQGPNKQQPDQKGQPKPQENDKSSDNSQPSPNAQSNQNGESGQSGENGQTQPNGQSQNSDLDEPYQPKPSEKASDPKSPGLGEKDETAEPKTEGDLQSKEGGEQPKQPKEPDQELGQGLSESDDDPNGDGKALTAQQSEEEQARQNWLKQIPDEPSLFLKRKFEYQYQQQGGPSNPKYEDKMW